MTFGGALCPQRPGPRKSLIKGAIQRAVSLLAHRLKRAAPPAWPSVAGSAVCGLTEILINTGRPVSGRREVSTCRLDAAIWPNTGQRAPVNRPGSVEIWRRCGYMCIT